MLFTKLVKSSSWTTKTAARSGHFSHPIGIASRLG